MNSAAREVLVELQTWWKSVPRSYGISRAYAYGSLVHHSGSRFSTDLSDIEITAIFVPEARSAHERISILKHLAPHALLLEKALQKLFRNDASLPIASIIPLSDFELENNIHKDEKPYFWRATRFVNLDDADSTPVSFDKSETLPLRRYYEGPVHVLKEAQTFRRNYLRVVANGDEVAMSGDYLSTSDEPCSKHLGRVAATLRYSIEQTGAHDAADPSRGLQFLMERLVRKKDIASDSLEHLWQRVSALRDRHTGGLLTRDELLSLWEFLVDEAVDEMGRAKKGIPPLWRSPFRPTQAFQVAPTASEDEFLTQATGPSLRIGRVDMGCKLFPQYQLSAASTPEVFEDDPESDRRVCLELVEDKLPNDLLSILVDELHNELKDFDQKHIEEDEDLRTHAEVHRRLTTEGSNAYPRLAAVPRIVGTENEERPIKILEIVIAPSRYGLALVQERKLPLPTARKLRANFILNSLAVRVGYIWSRDKAWYVEFHQRHSARNSTWCGAWDIGAAGYIDEKKHRDPDDASRISPWQTAAHELSEELGIPLQELPHRDQFFFFGVGRNDQTGQVDILGYCQGLYVPSPTRRLAPRVSAYDCCRLEPKEVADFIRDKRYWIPTAILTAALTLRRFGFSARDVETAFATLEGNLLFVP